MANDTWSLKGNALGTPPSGFLGTTDNNALVIQTGGTERLRVDTSGNVGIGTPKPAFSLDVVQAIHSGGSEAALFASDRTDSSIWGFYGQSSVARIWNSTVGDLFAVTKTGNVGVGTPTPAASLDVANGLLHVGGIVDPTVTQQGAYLGWNALTGGTGETDFINNQGLGTGGFAFMNTPPSGSPRTTLMVITGTGNVGIRTMAPAASMHANNGSSFDPASNTTSSILTEGNYGGGLLLKDGSGYLGIWSTGLGTQLNFKAGGTSSGFGGPYGSMILTSEGNVGIGTASPSSILEVAASVPGRLGPVLSLTNNGGGENAAAAIDFLTYPHSSGGPSVGPSSRIEASGHAGSFSDDLVFLVNQPGIPNHGLLDIMRIAWDGLRVTGDLTVTGSGNLTINGSATVAGDVVLTGADCAEHFDVTGGQVLEPGTVVVIDQGGALRESREAYDEKVAGVVSGAGQYRHAIVLDKRPSEEYRVPVALVGKVYCKVDAHYSPIEVGDLLTSSPTPGHAMKAAQRERTLGSVIGKALGAVKGGTGLIPILITLQ